MSRRLGEEGQTIMLLLVSEEGKIARARIDKSSGFFRLDHAALAAAGTWSAIPATLDGKPVCSWGRFSIEFRLTDEDREELSKMQIEPSAARLLDLLTNLDLPFELSVWSGSGVDRPVTPGLVDAVTQSGAARIALDDARHDALAMLSMRMTEAELAEAVKFYESPVGSKLRAALPDVTAQVRDIYYPEVVKTGCVIMQLQHALSSADKSGDRAAGKLPQGIRDAIPQLVQHVGPYCGCATRRASWQQDMRRHVDPAAGVQEACGDAPKLDWH